LKRKNKVPAGMKEVTRTIVAKVATSVEVFAEIPVEVSVQVDEDEDPDEITETLNEELDDAVRAHLRRKGIEGVNWKLADGTPVPDESLDDIDMDDIAVVQPDDED